MIPIVYFTTMLSGKKAEISAQGFIQAEEAITSGRTSGPQRRTPPRGWRRANDAFTGGVNIFYPIAPNYHCQVAITSLSARLLLPAQTLVATHYFTARLRLAGNNHTDKQLQEDYLDALMTRNNLQIHFGHYLQKTRQCRACGSSWPDYEEKMTDVNIAVQLMADTFDDNFDTALIISADSDLTTPVQWVRESFPHKKVVVAQPQGRNSAQLSKAATAAFQINRKKVQACQLPSEITTAAGVELQRPATWK